MNVEVVQKRLWEQSQQHRKHRESDTPLFPVDRYEGRIRNLMDLMHQPQWIAAACDRVLKRSRGKVSGVDRMTPADFERRRDFHLLESGRPGRMDTKALALFRDGYRCRQCGVRVTNGNSEADHIVPVKRFANFQQANVPTNVQILCLDCHQDKTAASR